MFSQPYNNFNTNNNNTIIKNPISNNNPLFGDSGSQQNLTGFNSLANSGTNLFGGSSNTTLNTGPIINSQNVSQKSYEVR